MNKIDVIKKEMYNRGFDEAAQDFEYRARFYDEDEIDVILKAWIR